MKHRPLSESQLLHMRIRSHESTPEGEIELLQEEKKLLLAEVRHLRAQQTDTAPVEPHTSPSPLMPAFS